MRTSRRGAAGTALPGLTGIESGGPEWARRAGLPAGGGKEPSICDCRVLYLSACWSTTHYYRCALLMVKAYP